MGGIQGSVEFVCPGCQVVHCRVGVECKGDLLVHGNHKLVVLGEFDVHAIDDHLLGLYVHMLV